jgi:tricorn protease
VTPPLDLARLLDRAADRKLLLSVRGSSGDKRDVVLRPVAPAQFRGAIDRAEADARRHWVDRASGGRLAYLAIESMETGDLEEFERQLYAVAHGREALLIDVRGNNGGWITDLLLACLMTPDHARTVPRGGRPAYPQDRRLLYAWNRPVVVLCDENSFSNAEIFAWAIKTLKRGPLVGRRTHGGVISTGSTTLLDGSTLRLPGRGWYTLLDGSNEEGTGCPPDVEAENRPDDLARGIDRQLEAAVAEGMRLIGK